MEGSGGVGTHDIARPDICTVGIWGATPGQRSLARYGDRGISALGEITVISHVPPGPGEEEARLAVDLPFATAHDSMPTAGKAF